MFVLNDHKLTPEGLAHIIIAEWSGVFNWQKLNINKLTEVSETIIEELKLED